TPAADENGVVAFFPDFGLLAYTPMARISGLFLSDRSRTSTAWRPRRLSPETCWGSCDQMSGSEILAVDVKTGRQRWKTGRPPARRGAAPPRSAPAPRKALPPRACPPPRLSVATSPLWARRGGGPRSPQGPAGPPGPPPPIPCSSRP